MDQLVADGPGASLQTSNTISPLLLLPLLPLSPCLFSHDLSIRVLHLPLVVRTSAPPMNAMAGSSVTCVSAADVSPHCLPPQPYPPQCTAASVEGLHSQWTRGGPAHPGNGPKTSSPSEFGPLGPSGEAFLARVCLSSRSRAGGEPVGMESEECAGLWWHTWRTRRRTPGSSSTNHRQDHLQADPQNQLFQYDLGMATNEG